MNGYLCVPLRPPPWKQLMNQVQKHVDKQATRFKPKNLNRQPKHQTKNPTGKKSEK